MVKKKEHTSWAKKVAPYLFLAGGAGLGWPVGNATLRLIRDTATVKQPDPVHQTYSYLMNQADVDTEYERLYDKIAAAKKKADAAGKPLKVVLGEEHFDIPGKLIALMIGDIVRRQGGETFICEQPVDSAKLLENVLSKYKPPSNTSRDQYNFYVALNAAVGDDKYAKIAPTNYLERSPPVCVPMYFSLTGYKMAAGDNKRYDKDGNIKDRYSLPVNWEMVDSVKNAGNMLAIFGKGHLPNLVAGLRGDNSAEYLFYDIAPPINLDRNSQGYFAMQQVDQLIAEGIVHKVAINGYLTSYADAMQMALAASIKHRAQHGDRDMTEEDVEPFLGYLRNVRADLEKPPTPSNGVGR